MWDAAGNRSEPLAVVDKHTATVLSVVFNPAVSQSGYMLASAGGDGIRLWSVRDVRD